MNKKTNSIALALTALIGLTVTVRVPLKNHLTDDGDDYSFYVTEGKLTIATKDKFTVHNSKGSWTETKSIAKIVEITGNEIVMIPS